MSTSDWPLLSSAYRAIYSVQAHRVAQALRGIQGVEGVLLRGSTGARVRAGLSDIDLVVILDDQTSSSVQLAACEAIFRNVGRVNLGAPLIRDVHVFTGEELKLLARVGSGLFWGIAHDSVAIVGRPTVPEPSTSASLEREALVRELWFWQSRTLRHLMDGGEVGRGLAARAFAKATSAAEQLDAPDGDLESLWRAYACGAREEVGSERAVEMLRKLDAVVPDAPRLAESRPPSPHPVLRSIREAVEAWARPLANIPAVRGGLLSVEGARETDSRLYLVLDPAHARAPEALEQIGAYWRKRDFPRNRSFSRFPWPWLVTPRQLERTVLARWTAAEPVARLQHGELLWGATTIPRASFDEIARGLILDGLGTIARLREILATRATSRKAWCVSEAMRGLFPSLEAIAERRPMPTRYAPHGMEWLDEGRALRDKEARAAVHDRIGDVVSQIMPRILARTMEEPSEAMV